MLVLTRRPGESLRIGDDIEVRVIRIEGERVVLGIQAPQDQRVVRSELLGEPQVPAAGQTSDSSSSPER